jgi:hypothetical protein
MKSLRADKFLRVASALGTLTEYLKRGTGVAEKIQNKTNLTAKDKQALARAVRNIRDRAKDLGASVTVLAADDLLKKFRSRKKETTYADLREGIQDIEATFLRESSAVCMYTVDVDMRNLTEDCVTAFGSDFQIKYPSALYDLEESCNCLALGRFTAAVFHLMRIMEVLLRSIHAWLGLPPLSGADKNWGNMLQAIKANMNSRNANGNAGWNGKDRQFCEDLYASLDAVRVAWRNTTMHVERRYDKDEAQHLFHVVRALSKKLAKRCDEQGQPPA